MGGVPPPATMNQNNFNICVNAEIGKAKQAYGPMAPGFPKLWAISKKYGPLQ